MTFHHSSNGVYRSMIASSLLGTTDERELEIRDTVPRHVHPLDNLPYPVGCRTINEAAGKSGLELLWFLLLVVHFQGIPLAVTVAVS